MPTIKQLPSGSYNTLIYDYTDNNGKRHYKSITAPSKKEVKLLVAEFLAQRELNKERADVPNFTVRQAIERYVETKQNILAPSTIRLYKSTQRSSLQGIMDIPVSEITSDNLQEEVDKFAENHASKTVKERTRLVKTCVNAFCHDKVLKVSIPQKKNVKIEIPTKEEVTKLLKCAAGTEAEVPLYFLAYCGMRPCEISALELADIDFEKGTAYIHQDFSKNEYGEYILQDRTKTPAGTRTIKLFTPVLSLLKRIEFKTKYITTLNPDQIYRWNARIIKKNKLKYYKPYSLRHYCVSVMLRLNIPKNYVADYIGHESEQLIERIYGHTMHDQKDIIFDSVNTFYDQMQNEMQDE